jgi:hypothetical protein
MQCNLRGSKVVRDSEAMGVADGSTGGNEVGLSWSLCNCLADSGAGGVLSGADGVGDGGRDGEDTEESSGITVGGAEAGRVDEVDGCLFSA